VNSDFDDGQMISQSDRIVDSEGSQPTPAPQQPHKATRAQ
jgi:hypothetical protein